jgi:hypothetical protein
MANLRYEVSGPANAIVFYGHVSPEWFVEQIEDKRGLTADVDAVHQGYLVTTGRDPIIVEIPVNEGQPITYVYKRHVVRIIGGEIDEA